MLRGTMIATDFAKRTRARVAEARAALTKFHTAYKEATKQLAKIAKVHIPDKDHVYDKLGSLAEDVVDKLPEEAEEEDLDKAYALQEKVRKVADALEDIDIGANEIEELGSDATSDPIERVFESLKESEKNLAALERLAAKLKI